MLTIWKYKLELTDKQLIAVPKPAIFLSAQNQYETLKLYYMVDSDNNCPAKASKFMIYIVGTGNPLPDFSIKTTYLGTVSMRGGSLVWHIYSEPYE